MKKNLVQILILAPVSTSAMAGGSASVAGWFGEIIGGLIATILLPVVWLIACKIIPKLRRKISVSYGVAITLATFIFLFLAVFGGNRMNALGLIGALLGPVLLFFDYRRAQRKNKV